MAELKNHPVYGLNGNLEGWISRSMAVFCCTLAYDNKGKIYVLASQRGKGTPDPELVGKWNCCTGYLDYNETTKEGVVRETREETGIKISLEDIIPFDIDDFIKDDPKSDKRQNVSFRYFTILPKTIDKYTFSKEENEKDEVGEIKWIPVDEIDSYQWAFNHDSLIKTVLSYYPKTPWMRIKKLTLDDIDEILYLSEKYDKERPDQTKASWIKETFKKICSDIF